MPASSTIAADLVAKLSDVRTDADLAAVRKRVAADEEAFGVRMRDVFAIAKAARDVPLSVVHELLD